MDHSQWKAIVLDQVDAADSVPEEKLPAIIRVYAKDHEKQPTRLLKATCSGCGYVNLHAGREDRREARF